MLLPDCVRHRQHRRRLPRSTGHPVHNTTTMTTRPVFAFRLLSWTNPASRASRPHRHVMLPCTSRSTLLSPSSSPQTDQSLPGLAISYASPAQFLLLRRRVSPNQSFPGPIDPVANVSRMTISIIGLPTLAYRHWLTDSGLFRPHPSLIAPTINLVRDKWSKACNPLI